MIGSEVWRSCVDNSHSAVAQSLQLREIKSRCYYGRFYVNRTFMRLTATKYQVHALWQDPSLRDRPLRTHELKTWH